MNPYTIGGCAQIGAAAVFLLVVIVICTFSIFESLGWCIAKVTDFFVTDSNYNRTMKKAKAASLVVPDHVPGTVDEPNWPNSKEFIDFSNKMAVIFESMSRGVTHERAQLTVARLRALYSRDAWWQGVAVYRIDAGKYGVMLFLHDLAEPGAPSEQDGVPIKFEQCR